MRKRTLISLILTVVMILPIAGIASAADSWQYYFPITVSDNSGATRTAYPIILEVGGQSLVDGGYLTANGTDARLRTTADKNLLMSTDNITFTVDSLLANGQITYNLYTGYSPEIDAFQVIVGDGGYVTVADNTTLELGDNFTIEQGGWWDTTYSINMTAVDKPQAFRTWIANTGNITSGILVWESPTGFVDSGGGWSNEANAYDENTASYALDSILINTWSDWLELDRASTYTNQVRWWVSDENDRLSDVEVDAEYDGGWQTVFHGAIVKGEWVAYELGDFEWVTSVRIRLKEGGVGSEQARVNEIDYGAWDTVSATGVSSGEHTVNTTMFTPFWGIGVDTEVLLPTSDNLVLNAPLWQSELSGSPFTSIDDYEHSCNVTGATWDSTGRTFDATDDDINCGSAVALDNIFDGGGTVIAWINPISDGENSNGRIVAKLAAGDVGHAFYILSEAAGWNKIALFYYFSGATDGRWTSTTTVVPNNTWTFVAVTYNADNVANVAILYINGDTIAQTDVAPVGIRNSDATANMRIGDNDVGNTSFDGRIGEVRVYNVILTPTEILRDYNATKWKYDGTINKEMRSTLATVPDNANDWTFLQNNVMPYADNITMTVGGIRELWFEPNAMIIGTTLPDRAIATANDGTITWGSNDNVSITFGSVTSYASTTSAASVNLTGFVLPTVGIPTHWWGMEFDGTGLPFYPTFLDTSTQTGIPLQTLYLILVFGAGIALATVTIVLTRSVLVGVAFYTITMVYGANAGIVAWWIVFTYIIMVVGIVFLSSKQAMGS